MSLFRIRSTAGIRFPFLLLSLGFTLSAPAEEKTGAEIYAQVCTACHGEDGSGNIELGSPPIAGLPRWYVAHQLERFRKGLRGAHPEDTAGMRMAAIAKSLRPESVEAIAEHVSGMEKILPEKVEEADAERGKQLYLERCASCHRFNASGEQVFRTPPLRAFPAWYLQSQFGKFANGQRGAAPNDADGDKMRIIAATNFPAADLRDIFGFIADVAAEK